MIYCFLVPGIFVSILSYFDLNKLFYVITVAFDAYFFTMFNSKQQNYLEKSKILREHSEITYNLIEKRHLLRVFIVHRLKDMFNHSVDMFYLRCPGRILKLGVCIETPLHIPFDFFVRAMNKIHIVNIAF